MEHPRLVVVDIDASGAGILGMHSKYAIQGRAVWHVMLDGRAVSHRDIALAIGLLLVDRQFPILSPQYFPHGPPVAVQFSDGIFRHNRGRTFSPWVLREIARLASVLVADYFDYLEGMRLTLRGSPPPEFTPLPPEFRGPYEPKVGNLGPPVPNIDVDLSSAPVGDDQRTWLEVVDTDYRRDRYMSHLSDSRLGQRAADILTNLPKAEEDHPLHVYWVERLTEVQAEARLRHGSYPAGWSQMMADVEWPKSSGPNGAQRPKIKASEPTEPYLVKYSQRHYLEPMLQDGKVRISPASRYADPSLNPAIRDDELAATIDANPFGLAGFGGLRGVTAAQWPGRTALTKRLASNYFVYCMSTKLQPRLFVDFGADACLVIHDPAAFAERINRPVQDSLPHSEFLQREVQYYDPMNVNELQVDVLTWKNFRYAYQREMRLAWIPTDPLQQLPPLEVEVGSLEDIGELIIPEWGNEEKNEP